MVTNPAIVWNVAQHAAASGAAASAEGVPWTAMHDDHDDRHQGRGASASDAEHPARNAERRLPMPARPGTDEAVTSLLGSPRWLPLRGSRPVGDWVSYAGFDWVFHGDRRTDGGHMNRA